MGSSAGRDPLGAIPVSLERGWVCGKGGQRQSQRFWSEVGVWERCQWWPWRVPSVHCPLLQHHCVVPTYNCAVSALAIHPSTNNLVIAYSDQQVGALLLEFSWPCPPPCVCLPAFRAFQLGWSCWHGGAARSRRP